MWRAICGAALRSIAAQGIGSNGHTASTTASCVGRRICRVTRRGGVRGTTQLFGIQMKRREFSDKVKLQAWERADGRCETCTRELSPGDIHYDHINPDACGGGPMADNCAVLCRSCHGKKTRLRDVPAIAKGRRIRRRHAGIKKPSRFRGWRRFNGEIVRADD